MYSTRFYYGSGTGKTRGSNFVPEFVPDGLDIRRISELVGKIAIPSCEASSSTQEIQIALESELYAV
jgi:hypothetical protein